MTNPNGVAGSYPNQFLDAGPIQEGCDILTCTDRVGGEHGPNCTAMFTRASLYVTYGPCKLCGHECDSTSVNVSWDDGTVAPMCGICDDRHNEGPDIPLDYTEDDE